ncbi:KH domain-containing protein [Acutalibacter caecimuris]|uniref:KH domain-containing protein n=1 Tax=Acutalibacter caecimuris TaxID=3093657 RepID=UPI002AC90BEA|nr:KH domain-containing protein [Acutalibacter sp. M00118]
MQDLLRAIASGLVEKPEEITVSSEEGEDGVVVFHLHVAEDDMGRVIGRQGRIAKAIRVVMRAAAARNDMKKIMVEID